MSGLEEKTRSWASRRDSRQPAAAWSWSGNEDTTTLTPWPPVPRLPAPFSGSRDHLCSCHNPLLMWSLSPSRSHGLWFWGQPEPSYKDRGWWSLQPGSLRDGPPTSHLGTQEHTEKQANKKPRNSSFPECWASELTCCLNLEEMISDTRPIEHIVGQHPWQAELFVLCKKYMD